MSINVINQRISEIDDEISSLKFQATMLESQQAYIEEQGIQDYNRPGAMAYQMRSEIRDLEEEREKLEKTKLEINKMEIENQNEH